MAPPKTMGCLDEETVLGFVDGVLPLAKRASVEEHVSGCADCLDLVTAAASLGKRSVVSAASATVGARPPSPAAPSLPVSLAPGVAVGRYIILDVVGRGGMGEVYAAYDPQLDRKIAVKLLHQSDGGDAADAGARLRLLREAKAIARLSHPNVVSVYDAGTIDGRVFVAMEFVEGETLAAWVARARQRGLARGNVWREIRDMFVQAGRGLAAAHAARIVHRDFKPQNAMVGGDGQVRVMDFGLASERSADRDGTAHSDDDPVVPTVSVPSGADLLRSMTVGLTRTGALVGTPAYMAPEQFKAEQADGRTDQFSFCVALYEALYGERPFASGTIVELIAAVTGGRVREAPGHAAVPKWLRRVLLRGLRVNRDERYPSMAELLSALEQDPVRRKRRLAALALIAAGVLAAGVVAQRAGSRTQSLCRGASGKLVGVWEAESGDASGRRNKSRTAFLATRRDFSVDTWNRVAGLLDDYAARWTRMYTDACEATHVRGEQSAETLDLRMSCLNADLGSLKTLTDLFANADAAVVVGASNAARALPDLDHCADLKRLRTAVPLPDDPIKRAKVEALRRELAELKVLKNAGRSRAGLGRGEIAVTSARALGYQPVLAEALETLMDLQDGAGEQVLAERSAKETLWVAMAASLDDIALIAAERLHEIVGHRFARYDEATLWEAQVEALLTRLGPGHDLQWAWLWQDRGAILFKKGELGPARANFEKALALKQKVLGPDHPDVGIALASIAGVLLELRDYQGAFQAADGALTRFTRAFGRDHPDLAPVLVNYAEALHGLGRTPEALAAYRRAFALWEPEIGADHFFMGYALTGIGVTLLSQGDVDGAVQALERALRVREKGEADPIPTAETRFALAGALWQRGDRTRAHQLAVTARAAYAAAPGLVRRLTEVDDWLGAHQSVAQRGVRPSVSSSR